jgi:NADH-quinone oxidoreductase subunit M
MFDNFCLSLTIFLPLMGALVILLLNYFNDNFTRQIHVALFFSILSFIISINLYLNFDINFLSYQFVEKFNLVNSLNIKYNIGIDGISLPLIILTTFLTPLCILASIKSIKHRITEYLVAFLLLETCVIGVFSALDLMLFYIFFELMLIPMYLIIGVWGGVNRIYASYKFFLYTLAGSLLLLLAIIYIYIQTNTMDIFELTQILPQQSLIIQKWLWLALFASFAVKIPMWPLHTWLPDAHVQAPTAGSVILAGVLLKMGGYGFIRFSLPMLPQASEAFAPFIFCLSCAAIIYASIIAITQNDMKKLIAYSSIAHMGFVTIGIFTFNTQGLEGAMTQMISHGLVSAALFLCVGVLYDRMHTREIADYGGVVETMPKFALVFMFFTMASIGLPGTSGFVGEILVLVGAYKADKLVCALAATGLVLGACYMLLLYKNVIFGEIRNSQVTTLSDLEKREQSIFIPVIIMVLLIGISPNIITQLYKLPIVNLVKIYNP